MRKEVTIFRFSIIRVAAAPFHEIEALSYPDYHGLQQYLSLDEQININKNQLIDEIYQTIRKLEDRNVKNKLLNIKRIIYNNKSLKSTQIERLSSISHNLNDFLSIYLSSKQKQDALQISLAKNYTNQRLLLTEKLKQLAQQPYLKHGLLLSSQSLLKRIDGYINSDIGKPIDKKQLRIESSLIKYLTRLITKTSPFSTFNNLILAKLEADNVQQCTWLDLSNIKSPPISHVRLNNYLWLYFQTLFNQLDELVFYLPVAVNSSLNRNKEVYNFLTNSYNLESFQVVPTNPLVDALIYSLENEQSIETLKKTFIDTQLLAATERQFVRYINELVSIGLLHYNWQVSGSDANWDQRVIQKLLSLDLSSSEPAKSLSLTILSAFENLRDLLRSYEFSSLFLRQKILVSLMRICKQLIETLQLSIDKLSIDHQIETVTKTLDETENKFQQIVFENFNFKPEQLIYEDSVIPGTARINNGVMQSLIQKLSNFLRQLYLFDSTIEEHIEMVNIYDKYWPGKEVKLLEFYEVYFRHYKKPLQLYKKSDSNKIPPELYVPKLVELNNKRQQWLEALVDRVLSSQIDDKEIVISWQILADLNDALSLSPIDYTGDKQRVRNSHSYTAFLQPFFSRTQQFCAVVNNITLGFGKMYSRFLHLYDPMVTEAIRKDNQSLDSDILWAENTDASYFNANIHPSLMPLEISIPGGHNNLDQQYQLKVSELVIKKISHCRMGLYCQETGKQVYVFDLGIQGETGRSPLFKLLNNFNQAAVHSYTPLLNALIDRITENQLDQDIIYYPRICIDSDIILKRRSWRIDIKCLPKKQSNEQELDYFLRVNQFRKHYALPRQVFISLAKDDIKTNKSDSKPQFIDFHNIFLVNLLASIIGKLSKYLYLEEVLPESEGLVKTDKEKYVSEAIIQWYE